MTAPTNWPFPTWRGRPISPAPQASEQAPPVWERQRKRPTKRATPPAPPAPF